MRKQEEVSEKETSGKRTGNSRRPMRQKKRGGEETKLVGKKKAKREKI